ncbi:MAG: hypothetical protein JNK82_06910, partial [Myxococcaceae bacterium]|nr:hypothetical protein [Myxococcaceae bacterium]
EHCLVPFKEDGPRRAIHVAVADPTTSDVLAELEFQVGRSLKISIAARDEIEAVHAALQGDVIEGAIVEDEAPAASKPQALGRVALKRVAVSPDGSVSEQGASPPPAAAAPPPPPLAPTVEVPVVVPPLAVPPRASPRPRPPSSPSAPRMGDAWAVRPAAAALPRPGAAIDVFASTPVDDVPGPREYIPAPLSALEADPEVRETLLAPEAATASPKRSMPVASKIAIEPAPLALTPPQGRRKAESSSRAKVSTLEVPPVQQAAPKRKPVETLETAAHKPSPAVLTADSMEALAPPLTSPEPVPVRPQLKTDPMNFGSAARAPPAGFNEALEAELFTAETMMPIEGERDLEAERAAKEAAEREEAARVEAARLEAELLETRRVEAARLAERLEAERLEAARLEAERLEAERLEAARLEAERFEAERLEAERLEAARLEAERLEAARLEAERLEAERLEAERLEAARLEAARLEAERLEAERLEAERLEAERLEAERLEAARNEAERAAAELAARAPSSRSTTDASTRPDLPSARRRSESLEFIPPADASPRRSPRRSAPRGEVPADTERSATPPEGTPVVRAPLDAASAATPPEGTPAIPAPPPATPPGMRRTITDENLVLPVSLAATEEAPLAPAPPVEPPAPVELAVSELPDWMRDASATPAITDPLVAALAEAGPTTTALARVLRLLIKRGLLTEEELIEELRKQ